MNMWGFNETVFGPLKAQFLDFIAKQADAQRDAGGGRRRKTKSAERDSPSEFLLPDFVASMIREGRARVRVLRGDGEWCGMTHPGDRARAARFLRMIVQRGDYPAVLW